MSGVPADPHVHAEATVVGIAERRASLTAATGRAASIPTSVFTGCGQRRPLAATSSIPEQVTCLPCRDQARRAHDTWAATLDSAAVSAAVDPDVTARIQAEVRRHRTLARRYAP